jgi:hypothetical protein
VRSGRVARARSEAASSGNPLLPAARARARALAVEQARLDLQP